MFCLVIVCFCCSLEAVMYLAMAGVRCFEIIVYLRAAGFRSISKQMYIWNS